MAATLGVPHVDGLLADLQWDEIMEWAAWFQLEYGAEADDSDSPPQPRPRPTPVDDATAAKRLTSLFGVMKRGGRS